MNTSTILIRSPHTSDSLRRKLMVCGSTTQAGHWHWCRSPACDRCRRHRATDVADTISIWADNNKTNHKSKITIKTNIYKSASDLLSGIHQIRLQIRGIFDRHQRKSDRWQKVMCIGYFALHHHKDIDAYQAIYQGISVHPRLNAITLSDAFNGLLDIKMEPVSNINCIIYDAIDSDGLATCRQDELSDIYNEINLRGGFKSLIYRRGFQHEK